MGSIGLTMLKFLSDYPKPRIVLALWTRHFRYALRQIQILLNDWMSQCLQIASWREVGKFTSVPQRNQARLLRRLRKPFKETMRMSVIASDN